MLTAEFCDGCKINNVEEIKRQGLSLKDVSWFALHTKSDLLATDVLMECARDQFALQTADKLIRTFAEQIFYTGFIHADPHPGNGGYVCVLVSASLRQTFLTNKMLLVLQFNL